jgi:hypothetical protein
MGKLEKSSVYFHAFCRNVRIYLQVHIQQYQKDLQMNGVCQLLVFADDDLLVKEINALNENRLTVRS